MQPGSPPDRGKQSFIETARRAQIVEAAITTIAEEGFAQASLARIARRASISPALISYHFASKDELIKEILRYAGERMDRAMAGGPGEPASYQEGLRRILVGYVQHCAANADEVTAVRAIWDASSSPAARQLTSQEHRAGMAELVGFLKDGQKHGEFRAFDPAIFAATLFAAMRGVPHQLRGRTPQECEDFAREWASLFEHAAAATGTAAGRLRRRLTSGRDRADA